MLSYRTAESLAPLLAGFTETTGFAVALDVRSADAIVDVFRALRPDGDPDLVISVDALRFDAMAALGAFRPLPADVLARVPVSMRDPEGQSASVPLRLLDPPVRGRMPGTPSTSSRRGDRRLRTPRGASPAGPTLEEADMCCPRLDARRSAAVLWALLIGIPVLTFAEEPKSSRPLVFTADDPRLEWGPCPEFLPAECRLTVLQGNPAAQNADVFLRLPPGSAIPHHWHTSAERMVLVSGELHLTYDGHDKTILRPGAYAYGPAKLPHRGSCAAGDPCVLFIAFEQPVDAVPTKAAPGQ